MNILLDSIKEFGWDHKLIYLVLEGIINPKYPSALFISSMTNNLKWVKRGRYLSYFLSWYSFAAQIAKEKDLATHRKVTCWPSLSLTEAAWLWPKEKNYTSGPWNWETLCVYWDLRTVEMPLFFVFLQSFYFF